MEVEVNVGVQCPFCGQRFDLVVDTSSESQRFSTECEICCHPFDVVADCRPGEVVGIEVYSE